MFIFKQIHFSFSDRFTVHSQTEYALVARVRRIGLRCDAFKSPLHSSHNGLIIGLAPAGSGYPGPPLGRYGLLIDPFDIGKRNKIHCFSPSDGLARVPQDDWGSGPASVQALEKAV